MKHNWEYKKAAEVCTVITDYVANGSFATLRENVQYKNEKDYAVLVRLADYTNDFDIEKFVFVNKHAYDFLAKSTLYGGEIIMSNVGSVGKSFICPDLGVPMTLAPNSILIRTTNNPFYFYYFKSNTFLRQLNSITSKTALPKFNKTEFKKLLFPVPPLPVQEQICSLLDKLSLVIEKKKQQVKELDNLAQAIFYDMFGDPVENEKGWEVKKIGEIGKVERGAGISKNDFVKNGLPCIHYGQLHTSFGPTTYEHKTCIPSNLLSKYKIAHPGDVIMAITSEDVEGSCKSTAWLGDYDIVVGSDAAIFHHNINGVYVSYYTQTKAFYNEKARYAKGFKVTHISASEIESITIPIPPLSLQQSFAQKIEAIERQKELINQSIAEVQTLFDSQMDYYFG